MKRLPTQFWFVMTAVTLCVCTTLVITIWSTAEKEQASTPVATHCIGVLKSDFFCQKNYVTMITTQRGSKVALNYLRTLYTQDPKIFQQCHQLAHEVGNTVARNISNEKDITRLFVGGDNICFSGFYHGVIEGLIQSHGKEIFERNIDNLCAGTYSTTSTHRFDYWNCAHGIGHGVMSATHNRLFDSLGLCNKLSGKWERERCYEGVFMENFATVTINGSHYGTAYINPSDPLYPCNVVYTPYKSACYSVQSGYAFYQNGRNTESLFALCRTAEHGYERVCTQSIGVNSAVENFENPKGVASWCALGATDEEQGDCIAGAAGAFVLYHNSDAVAQDFCTVVPPRFFDNCLRAVSIVLAESPPKVMNDKG